MKYTQQIEINLPREQVVQLIQDPDNLKHWQRGFIALEHSSGNPGEKGATSVLKYQMGKRRIEMTEEILDVNWPEKFDVLYEARQVKNIQRNRFEELENNKTLWISEAEFKLSGPMKIMGLLMKGAFKKQSYRYLEDFKSFAEGSHP
ncbi:MAG: SRPBCC family protein [Luteibaculum sp.]